MKILHICLCGPVTDNWNYQDNLLTKYHVKLGHEVGMITSQWIWDSNGNLVLDDRSEYINNDGVAVRRLTIRGKDNFHKKFKRFEKVIETIGVFNPDILFIHGCQFLDIDLIVEYLKSNPHIKVFVDNHADFSNSATNFISKNILHKIIWKSRAKLIEPYVEKFYGVLPARVDFLIDVYGVNRNKVELLVMGADDEKVKEAQMNITSKGIRKKYGIKEDDFLIVTGGKIDTAKTQTLLLMKAIHKIQNEKVKLLVFGSVDEVLKAEFNNLVDDKKVNYAGWINADDTYDYFEIADLVFFPGRHSVFWEQVVAQGTPMIVKYWEGIDHIDIGGNVKFLYEDKISEYINYINKSIKEIDGKIDYNNQKFLYSFIAEQSIS